MINNIFPFEKVLKYSTKQRYLKIPNQFNSLLYGDTAIVCKNETNDYTDVIYRFKKDNLITFKQIKIERKQNGEKTCKFCGEFVNKHHAKLFNMEHNPSILYFCNNECKLNWIYQTQEQ